MFWDNFYHLCELKNTTPDTICEELNLSTATATHWKNGTMPKCDVLLNIANLLDCSVDYLLGRTENQNGYSNNNNGNNSIQTIGRGNIINTKVDIFNEALEFDKILKSLTPGERHTLMENVYKWEEKIKKNNQY